MDKRTLVERARRGDHDAFATLAAASLGPLLGTARLILRDPELARDATQEALIRAWRDLPALRDPELFEAWIRRLTVNACLDLSRRRRRRVIEVELDAIGEPAARDDPSAENRDSVERALRHLEPTSRAIVVLRFYLGLSLPEIGAALQLPLGTVKTRLYRSLAAMRVAVDPASPRAPVGSEEMPA